jgi:hypothetical protein
MQVLAWIVNQQERLQVELPRLVAFGLSGGEALHGSTSSSTFAAAAPAPSRAEGANSNATETQHEGQQTYNYCCSLLAATTEQQWQEVLQMTPHVSAGSCPTC